MSEHDTLSNPETSQSQYHIIPDYVMTDKRLSATQKLLYGVIHGLTGRVGYCYATNAYLMEKFDCTDRTVQVSISELVELGYLRVEIVGPFGKQKRHIWVCQPATESAQGEGKKTSGGGEENYGGEGKKTSGRISNINNLDLLLDITHAREDTTLCHQAEHKPENAVGELLDLSPAMRSPEDLQKVKSPINQRNLQVLQYADSFRLTFERLLINHPQRDNAVGHLLDTEDKLAAFMEILREEVAHEVATRPTQAFYLKAIFDDVVIKRATNRLRAKKIKDEALQSGERLKAAQARTVTAQNGGPMTFLQKDEADARAREARLREYYSKREKGEM